MGILNFIEAIIKLGIPMVGLSWLIFSWFYDDGRLDRQADRKTIAKNVKQLKTSFEKNEQKKENYVVDKWMWFGGGFYGLAALWTFVVIEVSQFFSFIFDFPGFPQLFGDGLVGFLLELALNQVGNIISAFVWFSYWSENGSVLIYLIVAYLGYYSGVELAKQGQQLPVRAWLSRITGSNTDDSSE